MVKILYVIGQLDVGGTEIQLLRLVKHINRRIFNPKVICLSSCITMYKDFIEADCPVHVIKRSYLNRIGVMRQLNKRLNGTQPQIIHTFGFSGHYILPFQLLGRIRYHIHGVRTMPHYRSSLQLDILNYLLLKNASMVLTNSKKATVYIKRKYHLDSKQCKTIPNGLDIDEFDRTAGTKIVKNKTPVICAVANLVDYKRLDNLIKAFALINPNYKDIILWLIGEGPLREELNNLAAKLEVSSKVQFMGYRNDVSRLLKKSFIGVITSDCEGLSNAIMEYMAAGLPVVATNVGGNSELVIHKQTGLLVPPNDPEALANSISSLLNKPDLAKRFGEAGRTHIEQNYSLQKMINETEEVYNELLTG